MDPTTIPLSPVDYVFTGVGSQPITFAFHYTRPLDPEALRKSLVETLGFFPFLRSQLVRSAENEYAYLITEEGLTFDVTESDQSFNEAKDIGRYITPACSIEGNPLTRITLTRTPDGSILAVSISHALVDGFSYFHFLSSWARACRGERMMQPGLQRGGFFPAPDDEGEIITPQRLLDDCGLFSADRRNPGPGGPVREERIFISKEDLRFRVEDAKKVRPHGMLSENDVITASLWKEFLPRWIEGGGNPMTHVSCPVDFRRILKDMPRHYPGCAVCFASAHLELNALKNASIAELALLVNQSVRKVNHEAVVRSLQTLDRFRRQGGLAAMEQVHLRHPMHGLIVTNLTRMPIRDLDFGTGVPADFLIHSEVPGGAAIFPAENGVEVAVLQPEIPHQPGC